MIKSIKFSNYKLFKEPQILEIKPITVLIGKNSSGKSALTKLPVMLSTSLSGKMKESIQWRSDDIDLGSSYRDLIYERLDMSELNFTIESDKGSRLEIELFPFGDEIKITKWKLDDKISLEYQHKEKHYVNLIDGSELGLNCDFEGFKLTCIDAKPIPKEIINLLEQFKFEFDYVGPYRAEANNLGHSKPTNKAISKVGKTGVDAYSILLNDKLHNKSKVLDKLATWYSEVFEGWKINIDYDTNREIAFFQLKREKPREFTTSLNYVGQGISQILPLITCSFIENDEPILYLFEEPELHLHPSAHGDLAERFVASLQQGNKKYLIETHSENFILRLRRLIAENKYNFKSEDLAIYYINYDDEENVSNLEKIIVDSEGNVRDWPSKIFKESLDELIAIKNAKK